MKIYLFSFLSRLALPGLAVLLLLWSPALALADTITTFAVSGTAENTSGRSLNSCAFLATCGFSGMFRVDTTIGTIESSGFNISLPGLAAFDSVTVSTQMGNDWGITVSNSTGDGLSLAFTTAPLQGSLVGFTGGSIVGGQGGVVGAYTPTGGSITPVPEPSWLLPLEGGLGLLVFGLTRRFGKKSAIH
jgi:hypothetical protein